jgi:hypothetical protein
VLNHATALVHPATGRLPLIVRSCQSRDPDRAKRCHRSADKIPAAEQSFTAALSVVAHCLNWQVAVALFLRAEFESRRAMVNSRQVCGPSTQQLQVSAQVIGVRTIAGDRGDEMVLGVKTAGDRGDKMSLQTHLRMKERVAAGLVASLIPDFLAVALQVDAFAYGCNELRHTFLIQTTNQRI